MMDKPYEPEVDDYVIWDQGKYGKDEGWVYFKGDPVDNELRIKHGWNPVARYITIETSIKPKSYVGENDPHKYVHTCLLCYEQDWKDLQFVKKREHNTCEHYSQYDDVHGNE